MIIFKTNLGDIHIELDEERAPISSANFLQYVREGHYDGSIFHRVIKNFMIQGGGFDSRMVQKKTRAPIKNEAANGMKNQRYTVAMARTSDPHSATSQFFINTKDNDFLDRENSRDGVGYAVFGRVVQGMDVVDAIENVATTSRSGHSDVPVDVITVMSATEVA